jgi:predicted nucleic acid-binding protein
VAAPAGRKIYYWDASLFLAWLMNEPREPAVMEGIAEIAQDINDNKAILITSVITRTEVFEGRLSDDVRQKFTDLFKRRNVKQIAVDERVAELARQIREYYSVQKPSVRIETPDSLHLATAILYKADELHTTDGSGKRRRPSDLISLSGNVAGQYPLTILLPRSKQVGLFPGQIPPPRPKKDTDDKKI